MIPLFNNTPPPEMELPSTEKKEPCRSPEEKKKGGANCCFRVFQTLFVIIHFHGKERTQRTQRQKNTFNCYISNAKFFKRMPTRKYESMKCRR